MFDLIRINVRSVFHLSTFMYCQIENQTKGKQACNDKLMF